MEYGRITINRKMFEHWLYPTNSNRKFTMFEAWIELIRLAYFACCEKMIQGKLTLIPRGSFDTTVSQLSFIFKWNERTTEKFLKLLEAEGMITRTKTSKSLKACTLLKVNNYNDYQADICDSCQSKYKNNCNFEYCKKKNEASGISGKFKKPTLEEVKVYCSERKNGIDAERFINFYESKGWKIGKSPMKDWKAAIRTWEIKNKAGVTDTKDMDFYMRLSR